MSSHASAPPIDLELRPSRRLALVLFGLHALGLISAASVRMPPIALAAIAATVLTSFIVSFRRHALLVGAAAVRRAVWTSLGRWTITDGTGAALEAELLPEPTVGQLLVVLRFRGADGRRRALLLLPESADADQLRRLRARLRLG